MNSSNETIFDPVANALIPNLMMELNEVPGVNSLKKQFVGETWAITFTAEVLPKVRKDFAILVREGPATVEFTPDLMPLAHDAIQDAIKSANMCWLAAEHREA